MKTTIDLPDPLFEDLKRTALKKRTTLKAIVEASLRMFLASEKKRGPFKLKDGSVRGHGVQPGIREGDWQQIRDIIYEGRGS